MIIYLLLLGIIITYVVYKKTDMEYTTHNIIQIVLIGTMVFLMCIMIIARAEEQANIDNFKYHKKAGNVKLFTEWLIRTQSLNRNWFFDPFVPDEVDELNLISIGSSDNE